MKYIMITIHDNDFGFQLETVSKYISSMYRWFSSNSFTEEDIPLLKESVRDMLVSMEKVKYAVHWFNGEYEPCVFNEQHYKEYFEPDIKIVDESEIEEDGNFEYCYIPLIHSEDAVIIYT